MASTIDRLSGKMHALSEQQLAEVERFVESLQNWQAGHEARLTFTRASQPAFETVWSNPEDEVYDAL